MKSKVLVEIARGRMLEAVELGFATLKSLGVEIVDATEVENEIVLPDPQKIDQIDNVTEPSILQSMSLMSTLIPPVFVATDLFPQLVVTMVKLSLEHGNTPQTPYAYVCYGWLLIGSQGKMELGYQSGDLGSTAPKPPQCSRAKHSGQSHLRGSYSSLSKAFTNNSHFSAQYHAQWVTILEIWNMPAMQACTTATIKFGQVIA